MYQVIRERYDGKRARLRGRLTTGNTLQLDETCKVADLDIPHILWDGFSGVGNDIHPDCDPQMLFVHTLPGNNFQELIAQKQIISGECKAQQHMHVSLLIGD